MKALSVGMMTVTFVLGVGALAALFLLGKVVVELAQQNGRAVTCEQDKLACLSRSLLKLQ